ncbi:MAG: glycoside hydrolase family 6 protein [Solirubrobacteraceae bacterium]|jgi:endoglucanase
MRRRASIHAALLITTATVIALMTAGCGSQAPSKPRKVAAKPKVRANPSDPLSTRSFYVDDVSAKLDAAQLRTAGQSAEASAMASLAAEPTATWLTGQSNVRAVVSALTGRASAAGKSALLVAYDIPGRDCGGYSAGGAPSAAAYRRWITEFASGIGDRAATVIVEPDAIAQSLTSACAATPMIAERLPLLRFAVQTLRAQPNTTVYLDAGNPGWIRPATRLVPSLRAAGIAEANGFALNVANFYKTSVVTAYGETLSRALHGKHFVIDTSRNGDGAPPSSGPGLAWCNPPGRALGHPPTTDTGNPLVDAYLWIKTPGDSDGTCNRGDPPAGQWMEQYALGLALRSSLAR